MKILIIGSKGFIGSHCKSYFIERKHDVWEADIAKDFVDGKYFLIDMVNPDYSKIFNSNCFDICINCSGAANVADSFINPENDFMLNVLNVFKILESIRCFNPKCKFINLSSAAVYGNPHILPVREEDPVDPISPYGWHKWQSEILCKEYSMLHKISTAVLRIFSVYGDGLKKQFFWDLFQKAKRSNVVELFGSGNETRDFIYIGDLLKAIEIIITYSNFDGEIINVSSGVETTIKDAAYILCRYLDDNIKISFNNNMKVGYPTNWRADINKLLSYGFSNEYSLALGLELTTKWMKENT
jgi:dTDP-glucose 4,6-dehydratase/UDP-glucose 4-epimerase